MIGLKISVKIKGGPDDVYVGLAKMIRIRGCNDS